MQKLDALLAGLRAAQPQGDKGGTPPKTDTLPDRSLQDRLVIGTVPNMDNPSPSPVAPEDKILPPLKTEYEYQEVRIREIEELYIKAKAEGLNPISPQQFMADIETGNRDGHSMEYLRDELKRYSNMLPGVRAGRISPKKVNGGGKKDAIAWLEKRIEELNYDITTNGISTNYDNYHYYLQNLVNTGKDITYISNEERERKKQEDIEKIERAEARYKELEEKAEKYKRYTVGTRDGIRSLLEVKFTLSEPSPDLLVDLGEAPSVYDKYDFLRSKTDYSGVKREKMAFNREVDLNSAMKNKDSFKFFELSPRKGYSVATFGVDLDVKEERAKDSALERFDLIVGEALRWGGAARVREKEFLEQGNKKLALAQVKFTAKSDLDSYLMKKFDLTRIEARSITNHIEAQNLKDDMTANPADFADEPWYRAGIQKKEEEKDKEGQSMSPHVSTLNEIVAGKHDAVDPDTVGTMLDTAYAELEKEGLTPEIEALLNQAADRLTELLKEAARKVA